MTIVPGPFSCILTAVLAAAALAPAARSIAAADGDARFVWWEGENARATNFPERGPFAPQGEEGELLSGGDWLTNGHERTGAEAYARYSVRVPADGTYRFWTRKFYTHGPFRWRFDDSDWTTCGRNVSLADHTDLRTHVCCNWVYLGDVELTVGVHDFSLRLLAERGESLAAGFDCFVLSLDPFRPNGRHRPDERPVSSEPGFFAVSAPMDRFAESAMLDLRRLNEPVAGAAGRVTADGGGFRLGDGAPVRFWAVNMSAANAGQDRRSIDYAARRLAKLGVNMVRFHSPIFDTRTMDETIDERGLDNLFYLVAAMKREGIYTTLSTLYPVWMRVQPGTGVEGYDDFKKDSPLSVVFFDERMGELARHWMSELLARVNPYTGVPLCDEPAVAMVELMNEDSLFFWTFKRDNIPPVQWSRLETRFATWARDRYGSLDDAFARWGRADVRGDDPAAGRVGLYEIWHLTRDGLEQGGRDKRRRASDQARFMVELERAYFTSMRAHLRGIGFDGLVTAGNWTVADPAVLDALERYACTIGDVLDTHAYFGSDHEGPGAGYQLRVGHTYRDRSTVRNPEDLPVRAVQATGYPQIISELGWPHPNRFRADAAFIAAAAAATQGIDGVYFFAMVNNYVQPAAMTKFGAGTQLISGAFPAAALQYRRGDLREPPPVVERVIVGDDLYAMRPEGDGRLDALAFVAGPVVRTFRTSGDRRPTVRTSLEDLVDLRGRRVRSATGELEWSWGRGLVTVNTPAGRGAAGFLRAAGRIELEGVTIDCGNEFASITVIALDDRPLLESRRILIQAVTEERSTGYRTSDEDGKLRIEDLGGAPMLMRDIDASVTIRLTGDEAPVVTALDLNGEGRPDEVATEVGGGVVTIHLAPDAIHHIVTRSAPAGS